MPPVGRSGQREVDLVERGRYALAFRIHHLDVDQHQVGTVRHEAARASMRFQQDRGGRAGGGEHLLGGLAVGKVRDRAKRAGLEFGIASG